MGTVSGGGLHSTTGAAVVAWSVWVVSVVVSSEAVSSTTASRVVHTLYNGVHFIRVVRGLFHLYTLVYTVCIIRVFQESFLLCLKKL